MLALSLAMMAVPAASAQSLLAVWQVDPLVKVFRDAEPNDELIDPIDVARGEHAVWQVAVRCPKDVAKATVVVTDLKSGKTAIKGLRVRTVGYVPVNQPMPDPPRDVLRTPPCEFPDPLLETASFELKANQTQPVWVDVKIPASAPAGSYRADLKVMATVDGRDVSVKIPLKANVFPVDAVKSRLWLTNWYFPSAKFLQLPARPGESVEEAQVRAIAKSMAEHRQNVALIPTYGLTRCELQPDGKIKFDFSDFDRRVQIFIDAGVIGRIEGGHLGGRVGGWESPFVVSAQVPENGKLVSKQVDPASKEAEQFYSQFLPALRHHLKEKGWLEIYMQHLADEPIAFNVESYRAIAKLVRQYMPGVKTIDACHTKELVGALDVWVPQLNYFADSYEHYQDRQKAGEEVWMYTCVYPQGEYANRFIELPLIKTRLLHWINFKYNATGYLHWGFNYWQKVDDPYKTLISPEWFLPAGDPWIVYPGPNGLIDSIRYETMRDGVADHELLCQLRGINPELAQKIVGRHVLAFDRYDIDPKRFRQSRRELLEALAKAARTPKKTGLPKK